jgi:hypothetical protein
LACRAEEQAEAMTRKHPYQHLEKDPLWRELNKAIAALVKNGDVEERTARTHIVGYLVQALHASKALSNGDAKSRRVIRIAKNEEVVIRAGAA